VESFLNSILFPQHRDHKDIPASCLPDSFFDEPSNFLQNLDTGLPSQSAPSYDTSLQCLPQGWMELPLFSPTDDRGSSGLYQHSIEQPTAIIITPTNIMAPQPSPLPTSESPHSESQHSTALYHYCVLNTDGTWRCAYAGCRSQKTFNRKCDFRKHFQYHIKRLSCRNPDCPQAATPSFATAKDRARHEAKHKPGVCCTWEGCNRVFSRADNMNDHVRRKHQKDLVVAPLDIIYPA